MRTIRLTIFAAAHRCEEGGQSCAHLTPSVGPGYFCDAFHPDDEEYLGYDDKFHSLRCQECLDADVTP
jgi:hypothetical protein